MNTRPDATAWLTLVVLDGDCNAMILAHATSGRDGDWPVAVGHISERAGRPVEVVPAALKPPFDARPVRPELVRVGWVRCETEVMS
jgi:hypothetical protein